MTVLEAFALLKKRIGKIESEQYKLAETVMVVTSDVVSISRLWTNYKALILQIDCPAVTSSGDSAGGVIDINGKSITIPKFSVTNGAQTTTLWVDNGKIQTCAATAKNATANYCYIEPFVEDVTSFMITSTKAFPVGTTVRIYAVNR